MRCTKFAWWRWTYVRMYKLSVVVVVAVVWSYGQRSAQYRYARYTNALGPRVTLTQSPTEGPACLVVTSGGGDAVGLAPVDRFWRAHSISTSPHLIASHPIV
ncbi:hypothetical protein BKA80DRAFT_271365 [Phyllosticta citrichinensis]